MKLHSKPENRSNDISNARLSTMSIVYYSAFLAILLLAHGTEGQPKPNPNKIKGGE